MKRVAIRCCCTAAVVAAISVLSPVAHAAPPLRSYTRATIEQGYISLFTDSVTLFLYAQRIRASETGGKLVSQINYYFFVGGTRSAGTCTIPSTSLAGNVNNQGGTLSLRNVNTATLECIDKSGSNFIVNSFDWIPDGLNEDAFDGTETLISSAPNGGSIKTINIGNFIDFPGPANFNIVGEQFGVLTGTAVGNLQLFLNVSRTIEKTPGAPSAAKP